MSLSARAIGRPVAVAMLFLAVAFLGLISFNRLPIDLLPDVAYPRLVVHSTYANVAPTEVERFVSERIEQAVGRVPGVQSVESVSREGVSLVSVRFAWGTDMDFALLNVRERLDNLRGTLPDEVRPVVLRTDPQAEPIMAVSVAGGDDLWALRDMAESVFRRRIEQIDGVAEAAVTGGLEREIQVEVDPRLLESFGLTIPDIAAALDAANASAPGGTIRRGRFRYALRTLGEFQRVDEIAEVVVARRGQPVAGGSPAGAGAEAPEGIITLADVARVHDGFRERDAIARYNGEEAIGLLIFKDAGANTVRVAQRVESVLEELRAEYPAIRLDVATNQAGFISDAISNVVQALILGGILAFLVLFLFLRDVRYPVAIALAIPISVVGTFALLDLFGVSLNIMSLGGLALGVGMLVDNSIVVLENVFRHKEKGLKAALAAGVGAKEVQGAITASTLTTISVFGPIIYIEGVAGELFGAVSFAVAFSLLVSLVVALTLLPTMAARWDPDAGAEDGFLRRRLRAAGAAVRRGIGRLFAPPLDAFDAAFRRFTAWYHGLLGRALDHRARVVGISLALFAAALALGLGLDRGVLPQVDQGAFQARLTLDRGTPLEQTERAAARLEALFLADPDVEAVFTRVGRRAAIAGLDEEESGLNTAVLDVRLAEGARTARVLDRLRPGLAGYPPGALAVETGQATALGRLLGGGDADLVVRIRGDDLDGALGYARTVERRLAGISSVTNVRVGTELGQPEVQVQIDRERAADLGIEPRLIAQTVDAYMRGQTATEFVEFDRKIPIVVHLPEADRRSLETLSVLRVNGIPLREVVSTRDDIGPVEVRRVDQSRVVPVYADMAGRGLGRAIEDVSHALAAAPAPAGLRVDIGGGNEEMRRSFRDLAFAFMLALLLVYMILAAKFESLVHPFTILLAVPLAVIGAVLALWLAGMGLNTMSLIGMIVLIGIVVNDSIIKVDFINQARGRGLPLREAILEAGLARLRPIVMTTLTTVLGLTPMALGLGRGADLRAPLAIAVIGGLLVATALTLIVVPVAYDLIEGARARLRALFGRPPVLATAGAGGDGAGSGSPAVGPAEPGEPARPERVPAGGAGGGPPAGSVE